VHKGDKLYIEGRIHYASYDDKQGKRQYYTEIWADNMEMLTPKQSTSTTATEAEPSSIQNANSGNEETSALPF
jgi:single-strand DNA-binding protein